MGSNPVAPANFTKLYNNEVYILFLPIIQEALLALLPLLSFGVAFLVWQEHKKSRKETRFWKQREEENKAREIENELLFNKLRRDVRQDLMSLLNVTLEEYTTIEKNDADNSSIKEELISITKILQDHVKTFRDFEVIQTGNEIIKFADQLRRGHHKTRSSFQAIASTYQKYKALGGNHYVDEEWEFIKECMIDVVD